MLRVMLLMMIMMMVVVIARCYYYISPHRLCDLSFFHHLKNLERLYLGMNRIQVILLLYLHITK